VPNPGCLFISHGPKTWLIPETRSLIFLIKNSPDQAEGYMDYLQPLKNEHLHTQLLLELYVADIIIMKSSVDIDNNKCHYVILLNAGFPIALHYYYPAKLVLILR
jgi:hypothetical protein